MAIAPLQTWLQSRSADALAGPTRAALEQAAEVPDATTGMPDAWPVLVDTLDALAGLSAESDVMAAALLFGIPGLQAGLGKFLEKQPGTHDREKDVERVADVENERNDRDVMKELLAISDI